jgi:alkanesulfonate monooxygenase SsuD/methylene tetrahydromethanopterin reductase-like flavin-dependent oxidoreductase (luciferase family)
MTVRYDVEFNSAAHYPANIIPELALMAESAGFGAFWAGESNNADPFVVLSAIASRTSTIQLGTAAYHIYGRSPITLGIQSATLQDLSGGRVLLGLGVSNHTIASWHGGVFDHPLRRAEEYIDIVRKVSKGERTEFDGQVYNTGRGFKLAWKPEHGAPPVYLAGLGKMMTALGGRIGEGVMLNMVTPDAIREIVRRTHAAAIKAGKDPKDVEIVAKVRVALHRDPAVARNRLRQVLTFYNIAEFYGDMMISQGFEPEVSAVKKAFQEGGFKNAMTQVTDSYIEKLPVVVGTSIQQVKESLVPFVEAGVTRLIIPYVPSGDSVVADAREFLRLWEASE